MDDVKRNNEENLSMDEIFESMDDFSMRRGSTKEAEVYSIQPDGLLVLFDGKLDGFVPESELVHPLGKYGIGDKIKVTILKVNEEEGRSTASEIRVYRKEALKEVESKFRKNEPVKGRIISKVSSGYEVKLLNVVDAFLPGSHSGLKLDDEIPEETLDFKVINFRRSKRGAPRIVVSLKELKDLRIKSFLDSIKEGYVVTGVVESLKKFGAFVKLTNDVTGLIPASEVSWDSSVRIEKVLKPGDKVEAKVIGIDKENQKISLSLKQLRKDPWQDIEERFPVGSVHKGKVKSIVPFGFFVAIEDGIEGLVHISEVFWGNARKKLQEVVKVGDEVLVKVKEINKEKRTLSLSYREALGDPWDNIESKYPVGKVVEGKVAKLLPTGVIVELEEYVSGFVPLSEISWNFVDKVEDVVKEGDTVSALIVSVDRENRRMRLSLKKATEDPWKKVSEDLSVGDYVSGEIVRTIKSGAIVLVDGYEIEAFLPVSQVSDKKVENIDETVEVGQKHQFKIIRLVYDPENDTRNMVVSIRQYLKDLEKKEAEEAMKELSSDDNPTLSLGDKIKEQLKNSENAPSE
ncbi:30S ribosomal protein S1 [Kosmotoga arenicorallina S304]|uniref:30S ribosomal protein S1 n=1 Tax=Kosmotoga arenicorallina S304 TaxID=1453497 RepID=A0A176JXM3_9BACT|nr:S1 RNA-binding domain-containing protein [Kosmotoga arenicorallina]OAA28472.1 30S ribosomal protein S1 [Kosmotoga arenicorallina S304]